MNVTTHSLPFTGLSADQVQQSRAVHGSNVLTPPKRAAWWQLYLEKFNDPVIRILIIAAAIAIVAGAYHGEYIEGLGILIAILLSTFLGFWNEHRANKEFELLNRIDDDVPVKAIREGKVLTIPKRDVVAGDVLLMELGEEIPADGKLLEAVNLQINESRLTGESVPVSKRVREGEAPAELSSEESSAYAEDRLLRGTFVADGRGIIEVTSVGDATEIGTTARAASEERTDSTPLNKQLARLSQFIGVLGLGFAILTFFGLLLQAWLAGRIVMPAEQWAFVAVLIVSVFLALIRVWLPMIYDGLELSSSKFSAPSWLESESLLGWVGTILAGVLFFALGVAALIGMGWITTDPATWLSHGAGDNLLRYFMVSVTIIVVAVPEGLAMSVTLALAYSMRRMTASNNLVRRMHACETIGAATVICTDKTGTLTMNQMATHAVHIPALKTVSEVSESIHTPLEYQRSVAQSSLPDSPVTSLLAEALSVNSTAHLSEENGGTNAIGNPTESATLLWLKAHGIDYTTWRLRFQTTRQWTFSTERKFMGTLGQAPGMSGGILHVKGAPEIILARCQDQLAATGKQLLTDAHRQQIDHELKTYQFRGMRTLGMAYLDTISSPVSDRGRPATPALPDGTKLEDLANGMTWLGFFAIHDPIRPEVPDAIADCAKSGVAVKMVTGDNPATAREIARQIGLWNDGDDHQPGHLLTGPEFAALDDAAAEQAVGLVKVMARARPLDKLRLVRLLKQRGAVVAVTGDGTNDAPAMNYADVGLAMGKTGTAVAKEASDIILLDDSFKSIVNAIFWGRSLYQNIQRFILFQMTINLSALTLALIAAFVTGGSTPLTVMQLLWVNLIMDTFAALALATEPPDPSVMNRPPRQPGDFIITKAMAWNMVGMATLFVVLLTALLFWFKSEGSFDYEAAQHILRSPDSTPDSRLAAENAQQRLSIFFTFYVMLQFWNLFNVRRFGASRSVFDSPFDNAYFWAIAAIIFVGQFVITQFGGVVFSTYPLTMEQWAWMTVASVLVLVLGEVVRLVQRRRRRGLSA
ncbi:MAG TPA: cation-translocating P-type ATPase [Gemmatales bacterium]|nr:cation-translocating P-type ATPase [Gemmatales bacterium]